ncbi:hypothetical protein F2Q70_00036353 [Brassica cretica]|uniref:Uncharacterized protein n=1 Tax=Brassica cretica TaxID=69181 RepID=A0A8S9JPY8_BRACR|nr:hypothetical protein F2Q70_00036353 [Brassica cretica]
MPISGYESLAQPDSLSLKLQQFSEPTSDAHFFGFRYSNCFRTVVGVNTSNIFGSPSMPISGYESLAQLLPRRYQTSHKLLMYQKQLPLLQPDSLSLKLQQFSEPTSDAHFFGFRYSNCFRTVGNYSIKLALHLLTYIIY